MFKLLIALLFVILFGGFLSIGYKIFELVVKDLLWQEKKRQYKKNKS